jgi:hypothetical protein
MTGVPTLFGSNRVMVCREHAGLASQLIDMLRSAIGEADALRCSGRESWPLRLRSGAQQENDPQALGCNVQFDQLGDMTIIGGVERAPKGLRARPEPGFTTDFAASKSKDDARESWKIWQVGRGRDRAELALIGSVCLAR